MSQLNRGVLGSAFIVKRENTHDGTTGESTWLGGSSHGLRETLSDVKGQVQFLLYLADQIEESLNQLDQETDSCHGAFLSKVLRMYSAQLDTKYQGLGEKIAETCQEIYVSVREFEVV